MSDMAKMTNEELAAELERHESIIREDWVTDAVYVAEAARRLRGPDYKAEAMAARKRDDLYQAIQDGRRTRPVGVYMNGVESLPGIEELISASEELASIRTTNESKEAANG